MAQFVPYLKPYIGELLRMDEQTEFLWYPVDPSNDQTGVNYQGYVINPTERVLSPICIWDPPGDTDWHIVAGFALFDSEISNEIKNYLCFEARIYDDTSAGYTVSYRWTIRENLTGYPLLFNFGTTTTVYAIPGTPSKDNPQVVFNQGIRNDHYWIAMGIYCRGTYEYGGDTFKYYYPASLCIKADTIDEQYGYFDRNRSIKEVDDPNDDPDNPPDEEDGGGGNHNKPNQPIPKPGIPTISAAVAGFLTLYKLTPAEMSVFADDCLASDVWEAIKLLLSNPLDFIVGCSIVPFVPPGNSVWFPKFGAITFSHAYSRIENQYVALDCGDVYVEPFSKNFLDYAPFTRITIYLPYIGFRELDVNEVMGKTVNVEYRCDCLSGDCIAFIYTSDAGEMGPQVGKVLATYNGNCACQVPFASQSFNSLISASVNMLTNVASSVVKGDLPAMSGSGIVGALEALGGDVQKSGSIGSSNGYMGVQKPYLIKHIPKDNVPSAFRTLKGYPSNISGVLGSFPGYAEIDNIGLTNISTGLGGIVATAAELEEIQTLLRGGIFI